MTIAHPTVKKALAEWQQQLQEMTNNQCVLLVAYHNAGTKVSVDQIIETVVSYTGVPVKLVLSKSRKFKVALARQLIAYFLKMYSPMTLVQIGQLIGSRDHTTVIHSISRIKGYLQSGDSDVCTAIQHIDKMFLNAPETSN